MTSESKPLSSFDVPDEILEVIMPLLLTDEDRDTFMKLEHMVSLLDGFAQCYGVIKLEDTERLLKAHYIKDFDKDKFNEVLGNYADLDTLFDVKDEHSVQMAHAFHVIYGNDLRVELYPDFDTF